MKQLSLTDPQMTLIRETAKHIPGEWHDRFINLVADRLFAVDVITNADVSEAVHQVLQSMFGKAAVA